MGKRVLMKKIHILIISLVALLIFGAYLTEREKHHQDKIQIATTMYPVSEFTKNIVGDEAEVSLLSTELTEQDKEKAKQSDVLVYQSEGSEEWLTQAQKDWGNQAPRLVSGTKDAILLASTSETHDHSHSHGEDEHNHAHALDVRTYLSPQRAITEVNTIKNQLIAYYPEKAQIFEENASKYIAQLTQLDADYTKAFKEAGQKSFVTQNDSFTYLALDYGLTQVKLTDIYPDVKPSTSRLAELKNYVSANHIPYIYFDQETTEDFKNTMNREAGVQVEFLNPLEQASSKDHLTLMKENLAALQKTTATHGQAIPSENPTESKQTVAQGYFKDEAVKDRNLSDYAGDFQSVYPYLKDGTLNPVFDYKAKASQTMTAEDYKNYYDIGYKTDVDQLVIDADSIEFIVGNNHYKYRYHYDGYQILNYKKGNRGVRFTFTTDDPNAGRFKYVQFSDHGIAPQQTEHFHIFFGGESQQKLLEEMDNWPTYYKSNLSGLEVAQEMVLH